MTGPLDEILDGKQPESFRTSKYNGVTGPLDLSTLKNPSMLAEYIQRLGRKNLIDFLEDHGCTHELKTFTTMNLVNISDQYGHVLSYTVNDDGAPGEVACSWGC